MNKPCFVYVFGRDYDGLIGGPVKIGISHDPEKRLRGFQTASAYRLTKICHVYAHDRMMARAVEATIHEDLAPHRMAGEWFDVDPLQAMRSLLTSYLDVFDALGFTRDQFYEYAHAGTGIAEVLKRYHAGPFPSMGGGQ